MSFHTTSNKSQQELIELFIDDKPVQVPPGTTVLQVHHTFMHKYMKIPVTCVNYVSEIHCSFINYIIKRESFF